MSFPFTLLSMSGAGLLLAGLLCVLGRLFFRRLSPKLYYYAWLIVLLRFILPLPGLIPTAVTEAAPAAESRVSAEVGTLRTPRGPGNVYWAGSDVFFPNAPTANGNDTPDHAQSEVYEAKADSSAAGGYLSELFGIFREREFYVFLWGFGLALYILNAGISTLRFRKLLLGELENAEQWEYELLCRLCPGDRPALYRSKALSAPILIGLIRPRLILPAKSDSPEGLENILRHELTHHMRRDLLYKHFALLICAVHWFNPFMPLIRQEIERSCELSCDEKVLSHMDASARKSYGETLLRCAAHNALPAGLAVSSFCVQKRHLKERLEQVLKFKKKSPAAIIASLLVFALLCGCGAALGPAQKGGAPSSPTADVAPTPEPQPQTVTGINETAEPKIMDGQQVYTVRSMDEFLSAIGPDRIISMQEGSYVLSMAKNYGSGSSDWYYWRDCHDGYELVIKQVANMSIVSESPSSANDPAVLLLTEPRYANVLYFDNCAGISISGLSLGHIESGLCYGGVVFLNACDKVSIYSSKLFGCGTVALQCYDCDGVLVENSKLTDCSDNVLSAKLSRAIVISSCEIDHCGAMPALFGFSSCEDSIIADCNINGNSGQTLLSSELSRNISLLSSQIIYNDLACMFSVSSGSTVTVDGCSFDRAGSLGFIATENTVLDSRGSILDEAAIEAMEYRKIMWEMPGEKEVNYTEGAVHVSTVDELLSAIAPNVTIYLEEGDYDLSAATEYGGYGNDYYAWEDRGDGPSLLIFNCDNLSIIGKGSDSTNIYARPRYADVFYFSNCSNLTLSGFTAGHFEEPGYCTGDVIKLQSCEAASMEDLGLFGCGNIGIRASECKLLSLKDCDIYECTGSGLILNSCEGIKMESCTVRDMLSVGMFISSCLDVEISGCSFSDLVQEAYSSEAPFISISGSSNIKLSGSSFTDGADKACAVFDNCRSVQVTDCTSDIPGFSFRAYNDSGVHVDGVPLENSQGNW